jgi:hypothetical protein
MLADRKRFLAKKLDLSKYILLTAMELHSKKLSKSKNFDNGLSRKTMDMLRYARFYRFH